MSEAEVQAKSESPKWPQQEGQPVIPPVTHAALANAAARAAATNSRRDLVEYLRLRRKIG